MIYVVCGLIGAGKSTFAEANFDTVLDFDKIGSKDKQLEIARFLYAQGQDFCYITCYPTPKERAFFKARGADVTYFWITADFDLARERILKRNRERDFQDITRVHRRNKEYLDQLRRSAIDFINVNSEDKLQDVLRRN